MIVTSFGELTSKITKASVRLELIDSNKKSLHKGDHIIDDMVTGTLSSVRTIIQLSSPENGPKITYFNISASVKFHQTKAAYIGTVIGGDYQGPLLFVSRVNVTSSVELLGTNKQTDSPLNYQVWTILPVLFIVPFIRKYNWL